MLLHHRIHAQVILALKNFFPAEHECQGFALQKKILFFTGSFGFSGMGHK